MKFLALLCLISNSISNVKQANGRTLDILCHVDILNSQYVSAFNSGFVVVVVAVVIVVVVVVVVVVAVVVVVVVLFLFLFLR